MLRFEVLVLNAAMQALLHHCAPDVLVPTQHISQRFAAAAVGEYYTPVVPIFDASGRKWHVRNCSSKLYLQP
jgi:hypothetical protein